MWARPVRRGRLVLLVRMAGMVKMGRAASRGARGRPVHRVLLVRRGRAVPTERKARTEATAPMVRSVQRALPDLKARKDLRGRRGRRAIRGTPGIVARPVPQVRTARTGTAFRPRRGIRMRWCAAVMGRLIRSPAIRVARDCWACQPIGAATDGEGLRIEL